MPTCLDPLVRCTINAPLPYVHGMAHLPNVDPATLRGDSVNTWCPRTKDTVFLHSMFWLLVTLMLLPAS
jgi:hypothetical protein